MQVLYALYGVPNPISPLEQSVMAEQMKEDKERIEQYAYARQAYEGQLEPPLKVEKGEPDDNVRVNIIKPIVNVGVHYLFGSPPEIEVSPETDGEDTSEESPDEVWLDDCLEANDWAAFLLDVGINGAVTGTPWYALDTDDPIDNPDDPSKPFPRFHAVDPAAMHITPDPLNISRVKQYEWRYMSVFAGKPVIERKVYTLSDNKKSWDIRMERAYLSAGYGHSSLYGTYHLDTEWQLIGSVVWPKPWPPIAHCKNLPNPNQTYGQSDVTDTLIEAQRAVNFNLSNRQRIDKHHGHPKIFFLNYTGDVSEIDGSIGSMTGIPGEGVNVIQLAPAVDSVPASQLKAEIVDAMLEESSTPSITLGRVDAAGVPSGVALRMRMEPMLQKIEVKRRLYGPWLKALLCRLLELGGFGVNTDVDLTWPELVPVDMLQEAQSLAAHKDLGVVSTQTIASKLGYNWEQEKARLEAEQQEADARNKALQQETMKMRADVMAQAGVQQPPPPNNGGGTTPNGNRQPNQPGQAA